MRSLVFLLVATVASAAEFTTSLGDAYAYKISALTTDSAGNTYVVGSRQLGGFSAFRIGVIVADPIVGVLASGASDVFVSKLDPTGKLLFTDTFAGKGVDRGNAIAVDPSGNIYIAGITTSNDFPLSRALQTQSNINGTGFIMKLSNDGTTILYSTYLGGALGATSVNSLATDAKGNLYLTGTTTASDYPQTGGLPVVKMQEANVGIVMTCISAAGDKIVYSGVVLGGPIPVPGGSADSATSAGVAVDAAGNTYFAGNSGSNSLPGTTGFSGYIAKVNAAGTGLSYAISTPDFITTIAVDATGDAFITGYNFAARPGAPFDGYIAKLNPTGSAFIWNNDLGTDTTNSIALDAGGNVWVSGTTSSTTFANTNGWTTGSQFLVRVSAAGSQTTYSALYPAGTLSSLSVDPAGFVHAAGINGFVSAINPAAAPTIKIFDFENAFGGDLAARVSPAEVISMYGPSIGPATPATATPTAGFYPKTLAGVQVTINGANIPLLYVSANQINAVVPMGLTPNTATTVRVINGTAVSADYPVRIVASMPQPFPTVLNQDGTINSQTSPAKSGTIVSFYATGWQSNFGALADGQIATTGQDFCLSNCSATAQGISSATVLYGGTAPGIVAGVTQFNVKVATNSLLSEPLSIYGSNGMIQINLWVSP